MLWYKSISFFWTKLNIRNQLFFYSFYCFICCRDLYREIYFIKTDRLDFRNESCHRSIHFCDLSYQQNNWHYTYPVHYFVGICIGRLDKLYNYYFLLCYRHSFHTSILTILWIVTKSNKNKCLSFFTLYNRNGDTPDPFNL